MPDVLCFHPPRERELRAALGYRTARDALSDSRGRTVRRIPWRRTLESRLPDGTRLFRKLRSRRPRDATTEWRLLSELAELGLRVPERAFFARSGRDSVVGFLEVPGRQLDALIAEDRGRAVAFAVDVVAPAVASLHAAGFRYRDLYWNHLFATGLDAETISWIDVERAFRPRFRRYRWTVKDLAGLLSSWPGAWPARSSQLRFLKRYSGGRLPRNWRRLARAVVAKAWRIRAHVPKYG